MGTFAIASPACVQSLLFSMQRAWRTGISMPGAALESCVLIHGAFFLVRGAFAVSLPCICPNSYGIIRDVIQNHLMQVWGGYDPNYAYSRSRGFV